MMATCLFLITVAATAAEINFLDNPVWSTVLEKAKKEKKIIFLDGYATWCGPCKQMDAVTYKDQAVADYYNANFINVKYDMEKGEGKTLAEKYLVQAYPSLLFIDAEGVMLHKGVGYLEGLAFTDLGKTAKDPNSQYYTLKKNALTLSNAQFQKFAEMAVAFEDEDADLLFEQYLSKQADILANEDLITLVMNDISSLPNEKMLAYFKDSKAKVTQSGKFTAEDFNERLINLTLGYGLSDAVQVDQDNLDYDALKRILETYIPEQSFFVYNYFRAQYLMDNKDIDGALASLNTLLDNTPAKVTYDQICNAMISMGPTFEQAGKADEILKKFDAIKIPEKEANKAYMKDFVRAIIAIKNKDMEKFKTLANAMLSKPNVPENVKEDLKAALERIK